MNLDKTIAIYLAKDDFDNGIHEKKQSLLRETANKRDISIVAYFALNKKTINLGMKQALAQALHTKAKYLLIDEPASLYLTKHELTAFFEELSIKGLRLIFASLNVVFYLRHLQALLKLNYNSLSADTELHSSNIKEALKNKKLQGLLMGSKSFGYKEGQKSVIKQIRNLHEAGLKLQKICELLTINNIKTSRNKNWHPTTIKRILERNS